MLLTAYCFVDKLFKLPVDIKKSTLLFKLRMPPELMEAANPGCPEQFRVGDIVSLGVCHWPKPWHFIFSTSSSPLPVRLNRQTVVQEGST